jgi:hypothetical protein
MKGANQILRDTFEGGMGVRKKCHMNFFLIYFKSKSSKSLKIVIFNIKSHILGR